MAKSATSSRQSTHSANRPTARVVQLRKGATIDMVRLTCPDETQALRIAESFGTAILDTDGIRDMHERLIVETATGLSDGLGERAMQIHLQRIVGAYVGSAHGAGQFYSKAVTEARDATASFPSLTRLASAVERVLDRLAGREGQLLRSGNFDGRSRARIAARALCRFLDLEFAERRDRCFGACLCRVSDLLEDAFDDGLGLRFGQILFGRNLVCDLVAGRHG